MGASCAETIRNMHATRVIDRMDKALREFAGHFPNQCQMTGQILP